MLKFVVIDNAFPAELVKTAYREWPHWSDQWVVYNNPLEKKRALNNKFHLPLSCCDLLDKLLNFNVQATLELPDPALSGDPSFWGAGLHEMGTGDYLDLHLDSDRHPKSGLERRANAILFVGDDWKWEWGGQFELWNRDIRVMYACVEPKPGRLLLFESSDDSVHGVNKVTCPQEVKRTSLAVYYWSTPKTESKRQRAEFLKPPWEGWDPLRDKMRQMRNQQKESVPCNLY